MVELLSYTNATNDWLPILTCIYRTHDWSVLRSMCRRTVLRFDAASFAMFAKIYVKLRKMKNTPDEVIAMEDLVFNRKIIPQGVEKAQEALLWNQALEKFYVLSGECSAHDEDEIYDQIYQWWIASCRSHGSIVNIFKVMMTEGVIDSKIWLQAFPEDVLFDNRRYDVLLGLGHVVYLLQHRQSDYVIAHFHELNLHKWIEHNEEHYKTCVMKITKGHLQDYISSRYCNYDFFALHPLGLQVLVEVGFDGVICRMENEFTNALLTLPIRFNMSEKAVQVYQDTLNRILE